MASAPVTRPVLNLTDTFGAAFLGTAVSLVLFGVTSVQTWYYYYSYTKDGRGLKSLVFGVWALDAVHSALVCQIMWHYLVANYANPAVLAFGTHTLWLSVLANLMTSAVVQFFFAKRIFILAGKKTRWPLAITIVLLVVLHVVFGIMTVVGLWKRERFDRIDEITVFASPFAVFAVLADFAIAGSLCILLNNRRTGFKGTNNVISTMIVYAINRCLLTSAAASAEIVLFAVLPKSFWFLALDFVIGKLYANSFLATLNTRRALGAESQRTRDTEGLNVSNIQWATPGPVGSTNVTGSTFQSTNITSSGRPSTPGNEPITIKITKEQINDAPYAFEGEDSIELERKSYINAT